MMSVHYEVRGACAVIALDNPPVNSFGYQLRMDVMEAIDRVEADSAVKAVVLTGSGRAFSGGADITEFSAG
ncbi:MAG TPA: enoyl-CoA hydratase/isomerase family protein, partial [Spongiibacteraceae bacterium]|nr:enoyl-CoA hydratase/isomerase family protein [Spongiibacteraceae bacterium]